MKLLYTLRKIVSFVRDCRDCNFPIEKQKEILSSFPEPKDNYERSYFQYKCQNKKLGVGFFIISNFVSFFLLIVFYLKLRYSNTENDYEKCEAVLLLNDASANILPDTLRDEFKTILHNNNFDVFSITKDDRIFIRNLWKKHPFSFYFLYKCMIKVSMYSGQIKRHSPNAIITLSQFSFTSSILTSYCNSMNIEHINIMHGDSVFDIVDSFVRFNRFYVWDQFYKDLFVKLRAYNNQFIIEVPQALHMDLDTNINPTFDYTFYLTYEKKAQLKRIKDSLDILKRQNKSVSVRPHPRISNLKGVIKLFADFNIENNAITSIEESLAMTNGAISLNSTVLLQGYYNNKEVVVDDVTNIKKYRRLFEVEYIILNKSHKVLSEIIKQC